jgi:hypothetical protein
MAQQKPIVFADTLLMMNVQSLSMITEKSATVGTWEKQ